MKTSDERELREDEVWIAERVMGYRWYRFKEKSGTYYSLLLPSHWQKRMGGAMVKRPPKGAALVTDVPRYGRNESDALKVLAACLSSDRLTMPIEMDRKRTKTGRFRLETGTMSNPIIAIEDTLELAICRFAKSLHQKRGEGE